MKVARPTFGMAWMCCICCLLLETSASKPAISALLLMCSRCRSALWKGSNKLQGIVCAWSIFSARDTGTKLGCRVDICQTGRRLPLCTVLTACVQGDGGPFHSRAQDVHHWSNFGVASATLVLTTYSNSELSLHRRAQGRQASSTPPELSKLLLDRQPSRADSSGFADASSGKSWETGYCQNRQLQSRAGSAGNTAQINANLRHGRGDCCAGCL